MLPAMLMKVLEGLSSEACFGLFRLNALILSSNSEQNVCVGKKLEFHVNDSLLVLLYPAAQYSKNHNQVTTSMVTNWN